MPNPIEISASRRGFRFFLHVSRGRFRLVLMVAGIYFFLIGHIGSFLVQGQIMVNFWSQRNNFYDISQSKFSLNHRSH